MEANGETRRKETVLTVVKVLGLVSLICAYAVGQMIKSQGTSELLLAHFPETKLEKSRTSPLTYTVVSGREKLPEGYVTTIETKGWGGPAVTATKIGKDGVVEKVAVLSHKETPSFLHSLENAGFFDRFTGKKVDDRFQIGDDIQAISGATVSSRAFAKAVREGAHLVGRDQFNMDIKEAPVQWKLGANELILIVFFAIVIAGALKKYRKMRLIALAFGIGFLGFHLNIPLSISNFSALLLGYFPSIHSQAPLGLLLIGSLLMIIILRRNLYCSWMCPFGGMQEWMTTIGGLRIRLSKRIVRAGEYLAYSLLWLAFMIMFLTTNPALGAFEPYATLFHLKGIGVQWYLVSVTVLGAVLIPRFWCRFFCPVGIFFKQIYRWRMYLTKRAFRAAP